MTEFNSSYEILKNCLNASEETLRATNSTYECLNAIHDPINSSLKVNISNNVHEGDITLYVTSGGTDTNDGLSPENSLATLNKAIELMPDTTLGVVTISIGEGNFSYEVDRGSLLLSSKDYVELEIYGTYEIIDNNTFTRDATDIQKYTLTTSGVTDYTNCFMQKSSTSKIGLKPITNHSGTTCYIPSYANLSGTYNIVRLTTKISFTNYLSTNTYSFVLGTRRTSYWYFLHFDLDKKINVNNDKFNCFGYLYCNIFETTGSIRISNGVLGYGHLLSNGASGYAASTNLFGWSQSIYDMVIKDVSGGLGTTGIWSRGESVQGLYIENFDIGIKLYNRSEENEIDVGGDDRLISFRNVNTAFKILSDNASIEIDEVVPYGVYCENVTKLIEIDKEIYLSKLDVRIPFINGTTPATIVTINDIVTDYKLLDQRVVNKVVLPGLESTDCLELTTTERTAYTGLTGQIVYDTDLSAFYRWASGIWNAH